MLRAGSPIWTLWIFGVVTILPGVFLLQSCGEAFGFGAAGGEVDPSAASGCAIFAAMLAMILALVGSPS